MGVVYLAALVAGLGVLLVQIALGGRGDHHGGGAHEASLPLHGAHGGEPAHEGPSLTGLVALFLSFRFWVFASLGFGLSGTLQHVLGLASASVAAVVASVIGVVSGLLAALAFRAATRGAVTTPADVRRAVGGTGRVLVPLGKSATGKVRIEIGGSSIDLLATTDEEALARDELVLVEEVTAGVARVAKRPRELE